MNLDQFEELWKDVNDDEPQVVPPRIEESKEYQFKDMMAKYKLFANIFQVYFSERYGEKISINTFQKVDPNNIEFHL